MAFGDGKVITRLRAGSDLTTSRYETVMVWFSTNWPENGAWPMSVARPTPKREGEAA